MSDNSHSESQVAAQLVRDQHIISRFYLNRFADSEKRVMVYSSHGRPRHKSTKKLGTELDYFEYSINGQSTLNSYEKWFSQIENAAAAIYDRLHAGESLTRTQEVAWARFVATMFLRSRKVREQIGPELTQAVEREMTLNQDRLRDMQHELLQQGVLIHTDDLQSKLEQTLREMRAPAFAHLAGLEQSVEMVATNLLEKPRWFILEAQAPSYFITSDCPVQTIAWNGPEAPITLGNGFKHSSTAIVFPLSPKKLFLAGPQGMRFRSDVLGASDVKTFNTIAAQFGHQAVYASERSVELQTLVEENLNRRVFGENAFRATTKP